MAAYECARVSCTRKEFRLRPVSCSVPVLSCPVLPSLVRSVSRVYAQPRPRTAAASGCKPSHTHRGYILARGIAPQRAGPFARLWLIRRLTDREKHVGKEPATLTDTMSYRCPPPPDAPRDFRGASVHRLRSGRSPTRSNVRAICICICGASLYRYRGAPASVCHSTLLSHVPLCR